MYSLRTPGRLVLTPSPAITTFVIEEFGIYLNYVRKLSFEETPDYDFLRDLFTKALKSMNEVEDGIYDWMLLNNGKGWESEMDVSANVRSSAMLIFSPSVVCLMTWVIFHCSKI